MERLMKRIDVVSLIMIVYLILFIPKGINANIEVDALLAFKNKLVDPDNVLASWDDSYESAENPCKWFCISCNKDNSTSMLDLGGKGLSGQLVSELGNLVNLLHLHLFDNALSGSIPNEFGNLVNLVSLKLHNNTLSGRIPCELGKLTQLQHFYLNNNNLTGCIPPGALVSVFDWNFTDSGLLLKGSLPLNCTTRHCP